MAKSKKTSAPRKSKPKLPAYIVFEPSLEIQTSDIQEKVAEALENSGYKPHKLDAYEMNVLVTQHLHRALAEYFTNYGYDVLEDVAQEFVDENDYLFESDEEDED